MATFIAGNEILCYNPAQSVNPDSPSKAPLAYHQELAISIHIRNFRWSELETFFELATRVHGKESWWVAASSERVRERLGQPNLHPEEDLLLAYRRSKAVGYVLNTFEPPLKRVVMEGGVDPNYLNQGVGARLVESSLELATEKGARVAHIPTPHGALPARRLAKRMGFKIVHRYWEMRLKDPSLVPSPDIPPEFTLRSWVAGDEKTLTEIQNLAFAGHWGFSPNTVEEIAYRARMSFCRPEGILFIIEGEKAVGYCWTRMEQGPRCVTGFIGMMGSHPGYRGRGLGVTVMRVGVGYLRKAGADRVDLTVDSENHSALKIYRAGGFERIAVTLWYERRL